MNEPGNFNRLSEFINKLTTLEVKREQDCRQLLNIEKKLEVLQTISEKIVGLDLKIESLNHIASKLDQRDWELEDSLAKLDRKVGENTMNISNNVKEIKQLYQRIDSTYADINTKLGELTETIKAEYISNASFTKLQRNILWAVISATGAIALNIALKFLEKK